MISNRSSIAASSSLVRHSIAQHAAKVQDRRGTMPSRSPHRQPAAAAGPRVLLRPRLRGIPRPRQSEAARRRAHLPAAGTDRSAAVPPRSAHLVPLSAGLLALSAWLTCYYWRHLDETDAEGFPNVGLMVPICNVLAYLLGPVALAEPAWVAIGATVAAVLLLTARQRTARLRPPRRADRDRQRRPLPAAHRLRAAAAAGYASDRPHAHHAAPGLAGGGRGLHGVVRELPAAALCRAARRRPARGAARRPVFLHRDDPGAGATGTRRTGPARQSEAGVVLATSVMYLRLLIIIFVFNRELALALPPPLLVLSALGLAMALAWYWTVARRRRGCGPLRSRRRNPLELTTAATFAVLFVVISIASAWATSGSARPASMRWPRSSACPTSIRSC